MLKENEITDKLKLMISEKRYNHSIGVMNTSIDLACKYNVDAEKARIAGLLHDCAKGCDFSESLKLCNKYNVELDEMTMQNEKLIHAPLGAAVAKFEFGINDIEILNAIRYHTTGRPNMSMLEMIVCLADYIEPNRSFEGVEEIRELAGKDIKAALLTALNGTISFVVKNNRQLHPDSAQTVEWLRETTSNTVSEQFVR